MRKSASLFGFCLVSSRRGWRRGCGTGQQEVSRRGGVAHFAKLQQNAAPGNNIRAGEPRREALLLVQK
jgi:hypothetical protein